MTPTIAFALILTIGTAIVLVSWLRHAIFSDGYGRQAPPRSWADERESRSQTFARLAH